MAKKKKMKVSERNGMKCSCVILYIVAASLIIASLCCYWRDAHLFPEDFIIDGRNVTLEHEDIVIRYGITKNCKIPNKNDCEMPVGTGFTGDTTILVMQSLALSFHILNIFVMALSHTCYSSILYLPPLISWLATIFNFVSVIIFCIYSNQYYYPYSKAEFEKLGNASSFYKVENNAIIGQSSYKITFAEGFILNLFALIFGYYSSRESRRTCNKINGYVEETTDEDE